MPMLRGTALLADDFYLMSHDSVSGEPYLTGRVAGLGLAAALLGELALTRKIDLHGDAVVVVDRDPPADALTHRVQEYLLGEQHPMRDWLAFFGQTAVDDVAARLVHLGVLARERSRRPWREGRWVPISGNVAAMPAATLCTRLIRGEPLSEHATMLAGLAMATGLDHRVLWEVRDAAPSALAELDAALASLDRPLRELIGHTEATVGSIIASHRA